MAKIFKILFLFLILFSFSGAAFAGENYNMNKD